MPSYTYIARNESGARITGELEAANIGAVKVFLGKSQIIPVKIQEKKQEWYSVNLESLFLRVTLKDLSIFTRQLSTLLDSGLTLLYALDALFEQTINIKMKNIVQGLKRDVEAGKTFSDSLRKYPGVFSELYVNTVTAGEATGTLSDIMGKLADLLENDIKLTTKFKSAIRYPLIVLGLVFIVFLGLTIFIVPNFVKLYTKYGTELPLPTRILMKIKELVVDYWYKTFIAVSIIIYGFFRYIKTKKGKVLFHRALLNIPVLGKIFLKIYIARFSNIFSTLIKSGVPMLISLDIVGRAVGNEIIAEEINVIKENVRKGQGVSRPLLDSKIFPKIVGQMSTIGEKTGTLDKMLDKVSEYYTLEANYDLDNLFAMIEPFLVVFLGILILFFALGIFLPSWNLMKVYSSSIK